MNTERELLISRLARRINAGGTGTRIVGVDLLKAVKAKLERDRALERIEAAIAREAAE